MRKASAGFPVSAFVPPRLLTHFFRQFHVEGGSAGASLQSNIHFGYPAVADSSVPAINQPIINSSLPYLWTFEQVQPNVPIFKVCLIKLFQEQLRCLIVVDAILPDQESQRRAVLDSPADGAQQDSRHGMRRLLPGRSPRSRILT